LRFGKRGDCIIVVWSPAAVASPHVYEDARVALSLGILVQVFTGDLDPSTLPPIFRAQTLISIVDGEQIRRAVVEIERKREILAALKQLSTTEEADFELGVMGGRPYWRARQVTPEERANVVGVLTRKTALPPISAELCKAALEKKAGQLTYQVPKKMRRGVAEIVEVRLGLAHQEMTIGFMGRGSITSESLLSTGDPTLDRAPRAAAIAAAI
jgi:hypothetical protein